MTQVATPPTPTPAGLDPGIVTDTWAWDPAGGDGLLGSLTRKIGTNTTWTETFGYDTYTKRLLSRHTTIFGASDSFLTQYRYDGYYGRQKSVTYPSGFTAWKQYGGPDGDYGDLTALSDGDSLAPLWGCTRRTSTASRRRSSSAMA